MKAEMVRSFGGVILAGGLLLGATEGIAQQAKAIPDAQVESNVLKALAGAPELSTQSIQSTTVYGTVTLSGTVHDESQRVKAENLAARAEGVKKVVDELTLGDTPAAMAQAGQPAVGPDSGPPPGQVLMSDGSYGPADPPPADGNEPGPPMDAQAPPSPAPAPARRPMNPNGPPYGMAPSGPGAGQIAGIDVTVPAGAVLKVRINRGLDSNHIQPGTTFDGTVLSDIVAGGAVAIPRGATVQGTVVDAKKAGVFSGHGELSLQINSLTLGGTVYPVTSEVWQRDGKDKTAGTVNNTVGMGAVGAIFGALAGGGTGAAIGAGVGAGVGAANSASSPRGQIIIPPEAVLTFKTAQPAALKTVSQQEMARLSYAAGPSQPPPPPARRVRYYSPSVGYYYAPAY